MGIINTTRTYQYDSLGNLIRQEQDGCVEFLYNGASLDESKECGVIPGVIGTCRWEYTYDGRGNLISEDKYTRTTTGMDWENVATYVYDETNHMVEGKNELGEYSLYTYNGLGMLVARELIMRDNTHGYTDFHKETPSVDAGITMAEVSKESYVIDYTSATFNPLTMDEVGGFNYRYVYGLDKLSVKITSEGTNWWGQNTTTHILKDYYHQDRMGSTTNMTDVYGRVVGRADYNEWGQITYRDALDITSSYRRIYPQLNYTGHDWDDVLGMYYAKARFYSADDKRFVAMDPIKGNITDPLSLVSYLYCVDNPLRYINPLGLTQAEIVGNEVRFRSGPSLSSDIISYFAKGTRVDDLGARISADGEVWANIVYSGITGWVATRYLRSLELNDIAFLIKYENIVDRQKENRMLTQYAAQYGLSALVAETIEHTYEKELFETQLMLKKLNYATEKEIPDNLMGIDYGSATATAIRKFQLNYGLTPTDYVDSITYLTLANVYLNEIDTNSSIASKKNGFENLVSKIMKYENMSDRNYYPLYRCDLEQGISPGMIDALPDGVSYQYWNDGFYYLDYTDAINRLLIKNETLVKTHYIRPIDEYISDMKEYLTPFGQLTFDYGSAHTSMMVDELNWFAHMVAPEADWDFKDPDSWSKVFGDQSFYGTQFEFIYDNELITPEILGNMTYGYWGKALGASDELLYFAGGVVNAKLKVWYLLKPYYGEDEKDHNAVKKGIDLYEATH